MPRSLPSKHCAQLYAVTKIPVQSHFTLQDNEECPPCGPGRRNAKESAALTGRQLPRAEREGKGFKRHPLRFPLLNVAL